MKPSNYITEVKEKLNISDGQLAQLLGVSTYKIAELERGEAAPTTVQFDKICSLFAITDLNREKSIQMPDLSKLSNDEMTAVVQVMKIHRNNQEMSYILNSERTNGV